jgi:hypothetical protein
MSRVCTNLVHDVLVRRKEDPEYPPMYTVEVFTKKGTDSQACRNHISNTTGMVPGIYDHGTHYVTHMRLTLEILKRLNDFDFVLEVMGDYTGTDASLGPMHEIGDAHLLDHAKIYRRFLRRNLERVRLNLRAVVGMQIYMMDQISARQNNAIIELAKL